MNNIVDFKLKLDIENMSQVFHLRIKKHKKKYHLEVAATYQERYLQPQL